MRRVLSHAVGRSGCSSTATSSAEGTLLFLLSSSSSTVDHHATAVNPTTTNCALWIAIRRRSMRGGGSTVRDPDKPSNQSKPPAAASPAAASSSARGADYFEETTGAAVGKPAEGQRGYLGFGKSGRSMPINPLHVLTKVEDPSTKKVLAAMKKLKTKPDSVQLSDEQQMHVVNTFAESQWYGRFWRPFAHLNYKRMRRTQRIFVFIFTLCFVTAMVLLLMLYYLELESFEGLSEEHKAAYLHCIMGMRYSEIDTMARKLLREVDPLEALSRTQRKQLVVEEMMRLGWADMDWELESRTRYEPLSESWDIVHRAFWGVMYFGRMCTSTGTFYTKSFFDLERRLRAAEAEKKKWVKEGGPVTGPKEEGETR